MIPAHKKKRCAVVPFETGIHFRRKTDFFPEEDTTKFYSGFKPEPTRLQAEGHSHHTSWATPNNNSLIKLKSEKLVINKNNSSRAYIQMKTVLCVSEAQRIERCTSNPMVVDSNPT
ncbi:hypothetical protein TNCV_3696271 [Trichonephila clavipes]|nr:hypothetical protein TNCV_3696271 [Trichonephila clavipes]